VPEVRHRNRALLHVPQKRGRLQVPVLQRVHGTVIAFGCFDVLHKGHEHYLRGARSLGDRLVVVVSRDSNAGRELWHGEEERRKAVEALQFVDKAILGDEQDRYAVLRRFKPAIIALGYDQEANEKKIQENSPQAKIIRLKAFQPEKYKSSILKKKVEKNG